MINPSIFISFIFLLLSTAIVLSSSSWIIMWMGLEINMMMFIPIIFSESNKLSTESMIKYFLIQASGSLMFLFSMLEYSMLLSNMNFPEIIIILSMSLKLACAPLHQWFPSIVEGMSWITMMIILTWQKIAPFSILMNFDMKLKLILVIAGLSAMMGSLSGFNQTLLRKILAFSSISHLGWLISIMINKSIWISYFLIYIFLNIILSLSFFMTNIFHFSHLLMNKMNSFLIMMNILSLGGLPPLMGFFPKWISVSWLMYYSPIISLILILSALINLSFYLRMMYKTMLLKMNMNLMNKLNYSSKIFFMNSVSISLLIPSSFLFS